MQNFWDIIAFLLELHWVWGHSLYEQGTKILREDNVVSTLQSHESRIYVIGLIAQFRIIPECFFRTYFLTIALLSVQEPHPSPINVCKVGFPGVARKQTTVGTIAKRATLQLIVPPYTAPCCVFPYLRLGFMETSAISPTAVSTNEKISVG